MNHIVNFSGGRTSAYLVYLMEKKRKNEGWDVEYVFADTTAEHPKTYEFVRNVVKHFNINLTCLRPAYSEKRGVGVRYSIVSIDDLKWSLDSIKEQVKIYGGFTINRPNCTSKMKCDTVDKYLSERWGKENCFRWFGMRADEPKRLKHKNLDRKINPHGIRYLAEISEYDKSDIVDWWSKMPFDLEIPEHLGNCVFCIKKSDKKVALAERDEPKLFKEWESAVTGDHVRLMPADRFGVGNIYRKWLTPKGL